MNFLQIDYFLHVAATENFTAAASQLHVSKPAVSKQIIALEEELGVPLFDRLPRGLRLTQAGVRMRDVFLQNRARTEEAIRECSGSHKSRPRLVHIGVPSAWRLNSLLSELTGTLEGADPAGELRIHSHAPNFLMHLLVDGMLDMVISSKEAVEEYTDFSLGCDQLMSVRRVFLFSANGPLNACREPKDLAPWPFFLPGGEEAGTFSRQACEESCLNCGFRPHTVMVDGIWSAQACAGAGLGFTIADEFNILLGDPAYAHMVLEDEVPIRLYYRRETSSPQTRLALDFVRSFFKE